MRLLAFAAMLAAAWWMARSDRRDPHAAERLAPISAVRVEQEARLRRAMLHPINGGAAS
jgi:hypothetical protein